MQQRQRRVHAFLFALLQQLHTDVVHHFASKTTITEAPTNTVDQFVVMTHQRADQRRFGGIERHDRPETRQNDGKYK
ncbi:hypothetical protein D3C71_1621310 [compost metagenome]